MGISANSAAISTNIASISTNSENIDTIYNEESVCINDFDSRTGEYCGEWAGASLKKLPLWGVKVSDEEIDFEWPTPEIFAQMNPNAFLESIEFKTNELNMENTATVSSVRVNLSNGESSPVFEKSDQTHYYPETINFDPNTPIRAVEALEFIIDIA